MAKEYHPIIYKYLKKYQSDPSSRVFAPLAEAYRKAGLVDEAITIAREGLRFHPQFVGGRVALARAYFDKKLYTEVIDELTPIILDIPDNLVAQRLIAESCLILGRIAEALSAYKMLLYFAPQDPEAARIVQELEVQSYEKGALVLKSDPHLEPIPAYSIEEAGGAISKDPEARIRKRINYIETLQSALQRVARYRAIRDIARTAK
ncbi:MAG: hypothetical protein HYX41_03725 [Bdellovibrio sp.]|nr:hypothetical protein [Bdellovibrio sp.]